MGNLGDEEQQVDRLPCCPFCTFPHDCALSASWLGCHHLHSKGNHVLHLYGHHVCVCTEDAVGSLEDGGGGDGGDAEGSRTRAGGAQQPDSERGDADRKSEVSTGAENAGFEPEPLGPTTVTERAARATPQKQNPKSSEQGWLSNAIDRGCKENSWFGKKCLKIFKLFVNTFTLTFIAEWGDRSQLATFVLAGPFWLGLSLQGSYQSERSLSLVLLFFLALPSPPSSSTPMRMALMASLTSRDMTTQLAWSTTTSA